MPKKETTNQVTPPQERNPEGKGGFGDHPENRSDGRWSKENSFTYWMNYFKNLSVSEFIAYEKNTKESDRSVAASLAYARVANARKDLKEFIVVADRTEGRPLQPLDLTTKGESIDQGLKALKEIAEVIKDANRNRQPNEPDRSPDQLDSTATVS